MPRRAPQEIVESSVMEQLNSVLHKRAQFCMWGAMVLMLLQTYGNVELYQSGGHVLQNLQALAPLVWTSLLPAMCPQEIPPEFLAYIMNACVLLIACVVRASLFAWDDYLSTPNPEQALRAIDISLAAVFQSLITASIWCVKGPGVWLPFRVFAGSFASLRLVLVLCCRYLADARLRAYPPCRLPFGNAVAHHLLSVVFTTACLAPSAREAIARRTGGTAVSLRLVNLCKGKPEASATPTAIHATTILSDAATSRREHDGASSHSSSSCCVDWCTESEASTFPDGTDLADLPLNSMHAVHLQQILHRLQQQQHS